MKSTGKFIYLLVMIMFAVAGAVIAIVGIFLPMHSEFKIFAGALSLAGATGIGGMIVEKIG